MTHFVLLLLTMEKSTGNFQKYEFIADIYNSVKYFIYFLIFSQQKQYWNFSNFFIWAVCKKKMTYQLQEFCSILSKFSFKISPRTIKNVDYFEIFEIFRDS